MILVSELQKQLEKVGAGLGVTSSNSLQILNDWFREKYENVAGSKKETLKEEIIPLDKNIDIYEFLKDDYLFFSHIGSAYINSHLVDFNRYDVLEYNTDKSHFSEQYVLRESEGSVVIDINHGFVRGSSAVILTRATDGELVGKYVSDKVVGLEEILRLIGVSCGDCSVVLNYKTQKLTVTNINPFSFDLNITFSGFAVNSGIADIVYIEDVGLFTDSNGIRTKNNFLLLNVIPDTDDQVLRVYYYGGRVLKANDNLQSHIADILLYGSIFDLSILEGDDALILSNKGRLGEALVRFDTKLLDNYSKTPTQRSF